MQGFQDIRRQRRQNKNSPGVLNMPKKPAEIARKELRKKAVDTFKPLWKEPLAIVDSKMLSYKDKFDRAFDYWVPDMKRLARNSRMFWGTDYSQYATEIANRLLAEYRQPFQANIIKEKLETVLSQTLQNPFDMTFKPAQISPDTNINELSNLAISMYLQDKGQTNWKFSQIMCYFFALIQEGCEEMVIDRKCTGGLPRITFKPIDPLYYRRDPSWETMDPYDMREFWKFGNMTIDEMLSHWPDKKEELNEERARQQNQNDYGLYKGAFPIEDSTERWGIGQTHRVIEYSYLVEEERWWEYDLKNNRPFPETGHPNQSEKDIAAKKDYIQRMGLNGGVKSEDGAEQDGDVTFIHQYRRTEKKCVFAPSLSLKVFFEDGEGEIQVNRISKFPLGASHFRQQYQGVVESLISPQETLNRVEMHMVDMMARGARNAIVIDKAAVDPEDRPYWIQNWNNVGFRGWTSEGYLQNGGKVFKPFPQGQISGDMFNVANHMIELADIVGKTPAAGHGRLEQKQTSGKLFAAQYQAGLVASGLWYSAIEQHEREKVMAWLTQAKQTYAGPEREFITAGTNERFRINERMVNERGEIYIRNNIAQLPEQSVTVTPAPQGTTWQEAQRELYGYLIQNLAPDQAFLRTLYMGEIYKSTPNITDEKRQEIERAIDMQLEVLGLDMAANKLMLQGKIGMLKQQLSQQGMQMGGPEMPTQGNAALPGEAAPPAPQMPAGSPAQRADVRAMIRQMGPAQPEGVMA